MRWAWLERSGLEMDLDPAVVDDQGGDVLSRLEIANVDQVAARPVLEGERLHRQKEAPLRSDDLDDIAFAHERAPGDIVPGDHAVGGDVAGEDERRVARGRRQAVALAKGIDPAGVEELGTKGRPGAQRLF